MHYSMKNMILIMTLAVMGVVSGEPLQYTIDTKVDHYTADGQSPTFRLRYLVDD